MKIDLLVLQLSVIFLPGIVWARLDANYAAKQKPSEIEFIVRAFVFGLIIYVFEFVLLYMFGLKFAMIDIANASTKEVFTRDVLREIGGAFLITPFLAIPWLYATNYKWLTWLLQKAKATKRFGDEDLWDYTFNSRDESVEYVHVRDYANGYLYAGWVNTFSETDKLRELVLLDVQVYNFEDVDPIYSVPRMYLARAPENMHIEFPFKPAREEDQE